MLMVGGVALAALVVTGSPAAAQDKIVETVAKGCDKELSTYCKDVTPGEGRVLACLYAYEDKLSGRCEYALYDAAAQLERAVAALTYVASECDEDLDKYCSQIMPGEGRLAACLAKKKDKLSARCKQAMKDVNLELK